MFDQPSVPHETQPIDLYGDVALGVECAWPASIAPLQRPEAEEA
jgi:hypothetical protein